MKREMMIDPRSSPAPSASLTPIRLTATSQSRGFFFLRASGSLMPRGSSRHSWIPVSYGAPCAYYHLSKDELFLPHFSAFHDAHGFYATHLHECAHATGAKHRLDRDFTGKWTKDALAMEEMTAELAASFLLADLGIAHDPREDHAAYVASWLRVFKEEPRAIFAAAGKAQAAADWMHAQPAARLIVDIQMAR